MINGWHDKAAQSSLKSLQELEIETCHKAETLYKTIQKTSKKHNFWTDHGGSNMTSYRLPRPAASMSDVGRSPPAPAGV